VPPVLPPLLATALLAGLTFLVGYPVRLGANLRVDALDVFLLVFALVNLRLAWRAAGPRPPAWFTLAGLLLAALITFQMVRAVTPG
jgi:hypothetical protein